jgi:hypothetical protein
MAAQTALTIRAKVRAEIHSNEPLYRPFLPTDQQWPEFLAQILHIDTYVDGNIELMALATVLQTRIKILSRSPSDTDTDVVRECKEEFRLKTVDLDSRDPEVKTGLVEMICAING